MRQDGSDPAKLAQWVEVGPDDEPPFDEPDGEAPTLRSLEGGTSVATRSSRATKLANALAAIALSEAARAIVASLLRSAKAGDLASVAKLVASIKPLAESEAARVLVARLEKEVQSPEAGGVVVGESFSHLLQQHDEGHPLSVA